jgi:hypothetical protein
MRTDRRRTGRSAAAGARHAARDAQHTLRAEHVPNATNATRDHRGQGGALSLMRVVLERVLGGARSVRAGIVVQSSVRPGRDNRTARAGESAAGA